jgi:micrococcal nuclease
MTNNQPPYKYHAVVLRWIDGDTADLSVDLGFSVWIKQRFRLAGIDTPERGKPGYLEATEFSKQMAPPGTGVLVESTEKDKYGRYLAKLYVGNTTVNQLLLDHKHAKPYFGGPR